VVGEERREDGQWMKREGDRRNGSERARNAPFPNGSTFTHGRAPPPNEAKDGEVDGCDEEDEEESSRDYDGEEG